MKLYKTINILGTRGIPASHGGFETFAQHLALFLVARGWRVAVYCQNEVASVTQRVVTEEWNGIELRHVSVASVGPRATLEFDWHCVRDAARRPGVCLVLGYNGAAFLPYLRLYGRKIVTNMDGIEWRRAKWGLLARAWFWVNEWIAAWTSHRLVADHPVIADHLATRRNRRAIATIPYGGLPIEGASATPVRRLGLEPDRYLVSIARLEPDNNILALVTAFSRQRRGVKLVIVGTVDPARPYHRDIQQAASDEVLFPGAIYESDIVASLRFHARAYLHGHTVGGTNPSLVEALWAGNAVIAHDNVFNRWTAGEAAAFFDSVDGCAALIDRFLHDDDFVRRARQAARRQAELRFKWRDILESYEHEAERLLPARRSSADAAPKDAEIVET
jgi:glycosyltransferase involved in cell wall biosynthesis